MNQTEKGFYKVTGADKPSTTFFNITNSNVDKIEELLDTKQDNLTREVIGTGVVTDVNITGDKLTITKSESAGGGSSADKEFVTTGSGNAVTSVTTTDTRIELVKGKTFLTEHPTITISSDTTSTSTVSAGDTLTIIDSIEKDDNGHITKINTNTVTLNSTGGSGSSDTYSVAKSTTPETGYDATYSLTKNGNAVGDKINIANNYPYKGELKTCTTTDSPVSGYKVGEFYIELSLKNKDTKTYINLGNLQTSATSVASKTVSPTLTYTEKYSSLGETSSTGTVLGCDYDIKQNITLKSVSFPHNLKAGESVKLFIADTEWTGARLYEKTITVNAENDVIPIDSTVTIDAGKKFFIGVELTTARKISIYLNNNITEKSDTSYIERNDSIKCDGGYPPIVLNYSTPNSEIVIANVPAKYIDFDNTGSTLTSTNAEAVIKELLAKITALETRVAALET